MDHNAEWEWIVINRLISKCGIFHRETLLKSCWHRTPSLRPQAAEIAELLTNNTRLIQPCIGIPLSSIQIEGSNSLEIPLRQVRKSASTQGKANSFASKLVNFDLSLSGNSNNSETFSDPLLSGYPPTNYVTQYVTLQHSGGEQIYVSHSREGISSQVWPRLCPKFQFQSGLRLRHQPDL